MAVSLGDRVSPSGNHCSVEYDLDENGVGHVSFRRDSPPPLSDEDNRFYLEVVLPKAVRSAKSLNKGGTPQ